MAFTNAVDAWMSRITGYRGTMSVASVNITATIAPNDGSGGILGSAGPTSASIQDEDGIAGGAKFALTTNGEMNFDSEDIDNLETNGTLGAVIEHELGHVLGIGTLWDTNSFTSPAFAGTQSIYTDGTGQYTGAAGLAAWQTEFGQPGATFVPVELGGGDGIANGHWNEVDDGAGLTGITQAGTGKDFRNELMTGWLNAPTFVSQLTLNSLQDIGYTVAVPVPEPLVGGFAALASMAFLLRHRRART